MTHDPIGVRKSIGYMPDNFGVYDGMKVWEFLDFFAVAYQIPKSRRKAVIGDVLELLGPDAQAGRFRERPVARHEAAALPGQDAGARSAGADSRRALERPRPAGPAGSEGAA